MGVSAISMMIFTNAMKGLCCCSGRMSRYLRGTAIPWGICRRQVLPSLGLGGLHVYMLCFAIQWLGPGPFSGTTDAIPVGVFLLLWLFDSVLVTFDISRYLLLCFKFSTRLSHFRRRYQMSMPRGATYSPFSLNLWNRTIQEEGRAYYGRA